MSNTKKQHFVPVCYLNHFCAENGNLSEYNIKTKKWNIQKPSSICYHNYTYETKDKLDFNALENIIKCYEDEYGIVIKKILKQFNVKGVQKIILSENEELALYKFIILQDLRIDLTRAVISLQNENLLFHRNILNNLLNKNTNLMIEYGKLFNEKYRTKEELDKLIQYKIPDNRNILYVSCEVKNGHFLTSDSPTVFIPCYTDRIWMPLSPKLMAGIKVIPFEKPFCQISNDKIIPMNDDNVLYKFNLQIVSQAQYSIISDFFKTKDKQQIKYITDNVNRVYTDSDVQNFLRNMIIKIHKINSFRFI